MTYYTDTGYCATTMRPSFTARILTALELRKQRKTLRSLINTQLNDIGLTREDVRQECAKPLWVNPAR